MRNPIISHMAPFDFIAARRRSSPPAMSAADARRAEHAAIAQYANDVGRPDMMVSLFQSGATLAEAKRIIAAAPAAAPPAPVGRPDSRAAASLKAIAAMPPDVLKAMSKASMQAHVAKLR